MPKCLLEIGRRRLIEHQLDCLADAGVGPVLMVLGYCADEIREHVGIRAEYAHNPHWETTNSLYSFWCAREAVQGPVIILNSDVLFSPEIINRLLAVDGDALAVDSGSGDGREQMKVKVSNGRLMDMAKDLPAEDASGENVGIIKLTPETVRALFDRAEAIIRGGGEKHWLGAALREVARDRSIRAVDVTGLPWVEIDFPVDLDRARKEVWPAISGVNAKARRAWRIARVALLAAALVGTLAAARFVARPIPPPPPEWESLPLDRLELVKVTVGERLQTWWLLGAGGTASTLVEGPGPVRIESRLLDRSGEAEPYVLEVNLDGERLDWYMMRTRPSGKARHPEWAVSHKKRLTIDVPGGGHELTVRLVAPADVECLVRVRQLEEDAGT
jgi:choline kinase